MLYKDISAIPTTMFSFRQVDSRYYLKMRSSSSVRVRVVGKENELMFKLANDSIVTVKSVDIYSADLSNSLSVLNAQYAISKEQVELPSKSGIIKFRYYLTDGYIEEDVKEKWQDRLLVNAECILK